MSFYTVYFRGYRIHGESEKAQVTYQSPAWPDDPRIVKAPSLETAKRRIREELRRIEKHGLKNAVYLAKGEEVQGSPGKGYRHVRYVWKILNADKDVLVDRLFNPHYFNTKDEAREFADKRGWTLLEHFDY